jgi:hypothetical protein
MNTSPNNQQNSSPTPNALTLASSSASLNLHVIIFTNGALFELGNVVATPDALSLLRETKCSAGLLINRHVHGDFGDCDESDRRENEAAVNRFQRILSVYRLVPLDVLKATPKHQRASLPTLWIITEADRSVTTILCPHNY